MDVETSRPLIPITTTEPAGRTARSARSQVSGTPTVSNTTWATPADSGSAGVAPSSSARASLPACGSVTRGRTPSARSAWHTNSPCEPAPTTRQSWSGPTPERRTAALATASGSTHANAASSTVSGTGQVNCAGTATRSASRPGMFIPTIPRCAHAEVTPSAHAAQSRQP